MFLFYTYQMKYIFFIIIFSNILFASYEELLFSGNCITCHEINSNKTAPSLIKIRNIYLNAFPNKKDFILYLSTFVLKPNIENSLMSLEIDKYGLMPDLSYDKSTIESIASYIYSYKNVHN